MTASGAPLEPFTVSTDRLTVRPFAAADLALIEEASRDPFIPLITTVPAVYTDDAGRAFLERQHSRAATGFGWSMAIVFDGRPVGQIGLWLANVHQGRAELGYWVVESARGVGFAADAVSAVSAWAFANLDVHRLSLFIEPWNIASISTAERAGFTREALLRAWQVVNGEPKDMWSFARLRETQR